MQWLARISVVRPVFATVMMLVLLVLGLFSYGSLGVDTFPNVDIPFVIVTTRVPGATPAEIESDVTDRIEGVVNTLGGIDELRSSSTEGVSQVVIQFVVDKDADAAAQEVRDKIDLVIAALPEGADPPVVARIDPSSSAVLLLAITGDQPTVVLTELADKRVRRQIESIDGVGQVDLVGGRARQIDVEIDAIAMRAYGVAVDELRAAVARQNVSTPGGALDAGPVRTPVRIAGRVESPGALEQIVVRTHQGRPLRVGDVARVHDTVAEETTAAELDGAPIVLLSVKKQSGRNTVAVVDAVLERLEELQRGLPAGVRVEVVRDNSGNIRTGIHSVLEHLVLGSVLASLVVLFFLGSVRPTVIAALAIPISIVGTFAIMKLAGFTLNFLTLLALALSVGIVIDDAIVVLENIVRFVEEKKQKPFVAAVLATKEIGLAVLATTLSLMAIFIPIAFMGGLPGKFLASFGLTMAFAIGVSCFVSFTLTPMLAARFVEAGDSHGGRLARLVDGAYRPVERVYMAILRFCLRRRWVVVVGSLATLGSCGPIAGRVPGSFLPVDDQAQFEIALSTPEGTSLDETRLVAARLARDVARYEGVRATLVTIGEGEGNPANDARVYVLMTDPSARPFTQAHLMQRVREEILPALPSTVSAVAGEVPEFSSGQSQAQIQYAILGPDIDRVAEATRAIKEGLHAFPGAVDVDSTLSEKVMENRAVLDREAAARVGLDAAAIADSLRVFIAGLTVTTYSEGGERYDVNLRAALESRSDPSTLERLAVRAQTGELLPLGRVVRFEQGLSPSRIDRYGRRRQYTILANPAPGYGSSGASSEVQRLYDQQSLGPDYQLVPIGSSKTSNELAVGFIVVVLLGFVFMYLVLAAQFESWSQPIIILLSLPLTVPFALLSLVITGQTLNLFSGLGLLVLFGVVKKNAILQIDQTNALRRAGMPKIEAILEANRERLRPILMTTLAFVAGMLPLVISKGVGAGKNQASSGIVVGGQTLSLLLTLVAVPVAYDLFDQAARWLGRWRRRRVVDRGEADLTKMLNPESRLP
jgi:hydrophobic/amphiphilic exporter-1 (mainly G- bacteria), HAE1 family